MELRHKSSFCFKRNRLKRAPVPIYLQTHPESHLLLGSLDRALVGENRVCASRQLVVVKELKKISLVDIDYLVRVSHVNIVRPIALYHWRESLYLTHEWVDLDIFDILPLTESEVCNVMKQVILAVQYLRRMFIVFRFETICVNVDGIVKAALDWNHEPVAGCSLIEADEAYITTFLEETMIALGVGIDKWSFQAQDLLSRLRHKPLLDIPESFLLTLPQVDGVRAAAQLALRKRLIRSGGAKQSLSHRPLPCPELC